MTTTNFLANLTREQAVNAVRAQRLMLEMANSLGNNETAVTQNRMFVAVAQELVARFGNEAFTDVQRDV